MLACLVLLLVFLLLLLLLLLFICLFVSWPRELCWSCLQEHRHVISDIHWGEKKGPSLPPNPLTIKILREGWKLISSMSLCDKMPLSATLWRSCASDHRAGSSSGKAVSFLKAESRSTTSLPTPPSANSFVLLALPPLLPWALCRWLSTSPSEKCPHTSECDVCAKPWRAHLH